MALVRLPKWDTQLLPAFIAAHKNVSFKWGTSDCCLMAADAIQAMTGVDIASDFRGKYTDEASAFALIKSVANGTTVADAAAYCAAKHGLTEWSKPLLAQRGDLVTIQNGTQLIAGFVGIDGRYAISIGETGLMQFPISVITRAWKTS
ncbi:DUF6950 family protein [Granulicella mallensis]